MPFQKTVNVTPAPAVAGDFASGNPRSSVLAGPGGLVAGLAGVNVGKFAWVAADGITTNSFGTGVKIPSGFVHREQQALITAFLAETSMLVPVGMPVTLFNEGDFWAINTGPSSCKQGDTVYADYRDGSVYTNSAAAGATATGSMGATFTATGTGTSLAVTSVTGVLSIGETISGTGVPAGTTLIAQVSGSAGAAGTYTTSVATTASAVTVTSFGTVLTTTAVTGVLAIGQAITGTGIPALATIATQVSGAVGGIGTYTLNIPATAYAASTALTTTNGIQATNWRVQGIGGGVGEIVKISTRGF